MRIIAFAFFLIIGDMALAQQHVPGGDPFASGYNGKIQ